MATITAPSIADVTRAPLGPPAMRTFARIADAWALAPTEQQRLLGLTSSSTLYRMRTSPPQRLAPDLLERLSYIFGIYKALHILLEDTNADRWLRTPNDNPLFAGTPPIERMLGGHVADLYIVRQYLDWERGR